MFTIGLTGGIASGKSNAARVLQKFGAQVIDADKLGHAVYQPGSSGFAKVVSAFGADIVNPEDNTINRRVLGAKVFGNQEQMKKLTDIVWPEIANLARSQIESLKAENVPLVVLEAAVLFEAQWEDHVNEIWCCVVPPDVAKTRLMARNNLSEEEAVKRISSQLSNEERVQRSRIVVETTGSLADTEEVLRGHYEHLRVRLMSQGIALPSPPASL
eukprot:GILI01003564.1.p1 GENE.GILI01003564.1~~GILI01003564.1.p1  ORF type:complete len:215 (-),score=45.20 GILI01003564.1:473-1117(-)